MCLWIVFGCCKPGTLLFCGELARSPGPLHQVTVRKFEAINMAFVARNADLLALQVAAYKV